MNQPISEMDTVTPSPTDVVPIITGLPGSPKNENALFSSFGSSFIQTPSEISVGVTPTNYSYSEGHVNRYGDNTTPGTTDMSTAIQNAINVMNVNGGLVSFEPGEDYACIDIVLKTGVYLVGPQMGISSKSFTVATSLVATGAGEIVKTDGAATYNRNLGVIGLGFQGLGSGTAVKGVHFDKVVKGNIRYCSFNNISDQAILVDDDCGSANISENFAQNCLLDRSQSAKVGVLDVDGSDHTIHGGEYNSSSTSLSDANAYICAVVIRGGDHFIDNVIGEISDCGIHVTDVDSPSRFVNCRADLNYGNGFEIEGSSYLTNCSANRNGQETDNTYDGFVVGTGNSILTGCQALSLAADAWQHRYGFNDSQGSDSNKNLYNGCKSIGHQTAEFNFSAFSGAGHMMPSGAPKSFSDGDTTPDVQNYRTFRAVNTSATLITDFDGGVSGQKILVYTSNANTTFVDGGTLQTNTGANRVSVVNGIYEFVKINGVWYEVGGY